MKTDKKADFLVITGNQPVRDLTGLSFEEITEILKADKPKNDNEVNFCFAVFGLNGNKASDYMRQK